MTLMAAHLEIPEKFSLLASARTHNAIVKRLVRWEMARHGTETLPRHFTPAASHRYGYLPRTPKYIRYKLRRYGHATDLIKSGASRREILGNQQISVGGAALGGKKGITATLKTRFAWAADVKERIKKRFETARRRGVPAAMIREEIGGQNVRVKAAQLVSEVQRFTEEEVQQVNAHLLEGYMATMRAMPSIRRRIDQRTLFDL